VLVAARDAPSTLVADNAAPSPVIRPGRCAGPPWAAPCGHGVAPASPISVSIPLPGPLPEARRGPDAGKPLPWRPIQQEV